MLPEISLIITTYNRPDFLEPVLLSVMRQTELPREVIVGDDGSGPETRVLIDRYRPQLGCPLKHAWIEDRGFRPGTARNAAVRMAESDYIVMIDGDIVLGRHFVADHRRLARPGFFVAGSRGYLSPKATQRIVDTHDINIGFFRRGLRRRFICLHLPLLGRYIRGAKELRHVRSCHLGVWRDDYIAVNGFDNDFNGWGCEDSDFVQRLYHLGIKRRNAKLAATAFHLYHPNNARNNHEANHERLAQTIAQKRVRALRGYDQTDGSAAEHASGTDLSHPQQP